MRGFAVVSTEPGSCAAADLPPAEGEHRTLTFGGTSVEISGQYCITTLPGGHRIVAAPEDNDAYRATAQRLGYADDTARMCLDHEAAHSWLCAVLGLPESPTMRGVAGDEGPTDITNAEEDAVLGIQRLANLLGVNLLDVFSKR